MTQLINMGFTPSILLAYYLKDLSLGTKQIPTPRTPDRLMIFEPLRNCFFFNVYPKNCQLKITLVTINPERKVHAAVLTRKCPNVDI